MFEESRLRGKRKRRFIFNRKSGKDVSEERSEGF